MNILVIWDPWSIPSYDLTHLWPTELGELLVFQVDVSFQKMANELSVVELEAMILETEKPSAKKEKKKPKHRKAKKATESHGSELLVLTKESVAQVVEPEVLPEQVETVETVEAVEEEPEVWVEFQQELQIVLFWSCL